MAFAPHPVSLRQMQYVVAVAERRSFRKAAEDCHVAQPSLSAQVGHAEQALGILLFERRAREVLVTSAGRAFVSRAKALLDSADGLVQLARTLADPQTGVLRIGVIPTVGPYLLPSIAEALRRRFPKLTLIWVEEKTRELESRLARNEIDAAILALESNLSELSFIELGKDPFVLATARNHPFARSKRAVMPEELAGQTLLLLDDGHCFRDQALAFCSQFGAAEANYRATSLPTLVQMAAAGVGITLLPRLALAIEKQRAHLALRRLAGDAGYRTIALGWRPRAAMERTVRAVGAALQESYQALANS